MLLEILRELISPTTSMFDRFMIVLMVAGAIVVVGLLGLLIYAIIDTAWVRPTGSAHTRIDGGRIVPAHTTTTMMVVGKTVIPHTIHHQTEYYIRFVVLGVALEMSVEKRFFDVVDAGDEIEVTYGIGRLSKEIFPMSIRCRNV